MLFIILKASPFILAAMVLQCMQWFSHKVVMQRIISGVLLLIPVILFCDNFSYLRIPLEKLAITIAFISVAGVLVVLSASIAAQDPSHRNVYPQIRKLNWTASTIFENVLSSVIYLLAYETFFRGYLFSALVAETTIVTSLLINLLLYAGAHVHKGYKEVLLSVPFGVVLCFSVLITGNMWTAVAVHILLSLSNDLFCYRASRKYSSVNYRI